MPSHVVVDGSNIATEGRSFPSLAQLNEAVMAFMAEHPESLITVVVDATFGHRIDPKESAEFDEAVANNELVAPPAGAVGRGDAFVLSIANKVGATILTNDSYQEFHGQYEWLFDEGRLIGGKPVPHIGWVFVTRTPVRGPISRSAMKDAKRKKAGGRADSGSRRGAVRQGSAEASQPMPVPKAPPPGAVLPGAAAAKPAKPQPADQPAATVPHAVPGVHAAPAAPKTQMVNDLLPFLSFVEHHPLGSSVNAVVESYSSHGAYVRVGEVKGYVPLRLMADPPPRSAREFMKIGDAVTLVVESFAPARRSIDLAVAGMSSAAPVPAKAPRRGKKAAPAPAVEAAPALAETTEPAAAVETAPAPKRAKRASKQAPPPAPAAATEPPAEEAPKPAKRSRATKSPAATAEPAAPAAAPAAPARAGRGSKKAAAAVTEQAAPAAKKAATAKKAPATKKAPAEKKVAATPAKRTRAKAAPDAPAATAAEAPAAVVVEVADATAPAPRGRRRRASS